MQQHSNILRKKSSNFNYLQAIFLIILSCLHITNLFIKPKYTYAVNNLNLFIGSNYIADETISRYEKSCNCHLEQNFFNDNEEMLAKIIAGATGYDVIVATTYAVEELAKMHKILPLDHSKIYNLNQINTKFLNQDFDPTLKHDCIQQTFLSFLILFS